MILERILAATPSGARQGLRRLKYHLMGRMSPAAYWDLAARISAKAAIATDCVDDETFFASGQREANLIRRKGLLGPDVRVINIGCGIGRIENAIWEEVASIVGVDVSSRMVELARRKVQASNVSFRTVDGKTLNGIESERYQLCLSFIVLQHIPRSATASYMSEVGRVLKPGGRFLFQIPLRTSGRHSEPPADHPFGIRFYTRQEISELLERAGLRLLENFDDRGEAPTESALDDPSYEFFLAVRMSTRHAFRTQSHSESVASRAPQSESPMDGTRIEVNCRVCDSTSHSQYLEGGSYRIVECRDCGLRYVNPQPSERELNDCYANFDLEGGSWRRDDGDADFDRAICTVVLRYRQRGSLLDVGSSDGTFLLAMQRSGFIVYGVEPSAKSSEVARATHGIPTYTGTVEEFLSAPPGERFDVITLLNVLEHLRDPKAVLRGLWGTVADSGILVIVVPDARLHAALGRMRAFLGFSDPYWMRPGKQQLVGFWPPRHLCSFDPKTITALVEKCGFERIEARSAPIVLNGPIWRNFAKAMVRAGSNFLRSVSFGHLVVGYSTLIVARKADSNAVA